MHVPAEARSQALGPQDQVALVTKAIQEDVILLILAVSTVVYQGHNVSLQQRVKMRTCSSRQGHEGALGFRCLQSPACLRPDQPSCCYYWEEPLPVLQDPNSSLASTSNLSCQLSPS